MKQIKRAALAASFFALLAGGALAETRPLTVNIEDATSWVRNFNPFMVGTARESTLDFIYEPLVIFNKYQNDKVTYRLATAYALSEDLKSVTFTFRDGVLWSDGQPLTTKDVLFTYDFIKKTPALDATGIWAKLNTVEAVGTNQVKFTFKVPSSLSAAKINDVPIVPEHVWKDVANPATFANDTPVGSGPMTEIPRFTEQTYDQCRNPHYWDAANLKVDCLRFPELGTNDQMLTALASGDLDWGAAFIPEIKKTYIAADPDHFHYWFPPGTLVGFIFNLESSDPGNRKAFDDIKFRRAVSMAFDRDAMVNIAAYGYPTPNTDASGIGASFPTWTDQAVVDKHKAEMTYDVDAAKKALADAGYADKDGDGFVDNPDGSKIKFDVIVPNGWTDWVSTVQIAVEGMNAIGIDAKMATPESAVWQSQIADGSFQMAINSWHSRATPFYTYFEAFNEGSIGKTRFAGHRYHDDAVQQLLAAYEATADSAKQHDIIHQLQAKIADALPFLPVFNNPIWYEYSSRHFTGWADKDTPWIDPSSYSEHYRLLQLLALKPTGM